MNMTCLIFQLFSDNATMLASVSKGKTQNAGYMFITNDVLDNPYDTIPPYYGQMVSALNAVATG